MKKKLFLTSIAILVLKNTYNYIARANFNRDSPKIKFKIYLSYSSWGIDLRPGSYVLGTKTFDLVDHIFYFELTKNADLEFSKFDIFTSEA